MTLCWHKRLSGLINMGRVQVPSGATPITLNYTIVKVFFARRITKLLSVVHNCNYLLALLLSTQFENFNMWLQIFIMLSGTNSVFRHFPWLGKWQKTLFVKTHYPFRKMRKSQEQYRFWIEFYIVFIKFFFLWLLFKSGGGDVRF